MDLGFPRRGLLSVLGAGAGVLLLPGSPRPARAESALAALSRFVAVYMPHGVARELWRPRADFVIDYPEASLAPFDEPAVYGRSLREQLLVIEGLDLTTGIQGGSAGHDGSRVLLTGSAGDGKTASLDQFLAIERDLGASTPLASLVLGVGDASTALGHCISYAAGGSALPKLIDPSQTFHEVFGKWQLGADPAARAEAERARRRGQSVLDAITADLSALSSRLGESERPKLEQHAAALRELEKRLGAFELACTPPLAPDAAAFPRLDGAVYFDTITDLQIELLAQALACGVTRFATLFLADLSHTGLDPLLPSDVHEGVAHRYSESRPESVALLARQNRYCHAKVARLGARLHELGLLDETLVLASSDMGDPARHSSRSVPTLLLGGGATFRPGRYLDVRSADGGVPNNRLLVSLARAFGADIDAYGESPDARVLGGELSLLT